MPSELLVPIAQIENIRPHSDPEVERLELATILGWQIVAGKGLYTDGTRVAYIPPDSLISEVLADELGIRQHLSSVKNIDGTLVTNDKGEQMLRVRQAKLRGEPSFGTTVSQDVAEKYGVDLTLPLGTNVAEELGIAKYEPQMRASAGDAEADHPLFPKYTSIENLRNYPNVLEDGEPVSVSIKIHGTNCRVGLIEGEWMAGSHGLRRKEPSDYSKNTYWFPLSIPEVKSMIEKLGENHKQVVLFGEVYGNVQKKYNYGIPNGIGFRAFDLLLDGRYVDSEEFRSICDYNKVETVVHWEEMAYSLERIKALAESVEKDPLGDHPIEGVVIKPLAERTDRRVGRVILKYVTDTYLFDKGGSDFKDV